MGVLAPCRISVQRRIRMFPQTPHLQVHKKKRKVIENVDLHKTLIGFGGIEQGRASIEHTDIAEMQITVANPHPSGTRPPHQMPPLCPVHRFERPQIFRDRVRAEDIAMALQTVTELFNRQRYAGVAPLIHHDLCNPVQRGDLVCGTAHQFRCQRARIGLIAKQTPGVKPNHFHDPVNRRPGSIDGQLSADVTVDRPDPQIQVRRGSAIQGELPFTIRAPLVRRAVVKEVQNDGAFQLENPVTGKEQHRNMRINPFDARHGGAIGCGIR